MYRFALATLLKSPRTFAISTRRPSQVKNNYSLVLFLAHNPLSFLDFEPAVQTCLFCELDPGINVYLRFSHSVLAEKSLEPCFYYK